MLLSSYPFVAPGPALLGESVTEVTGEARAMTPLTGTWPVQVAQCSAVVLGCFTVLSVASCSVHGAVERVWTEGAPVCLLCSRPPPSHGAIMMPREHRIWMPVEVGVQGNRLRPRKGGAGTPPPKGQPSSLHAHSLLPWVGRLLCLP